MADEPEPVLAQTDLDAAEPVPVAELEVIELKDIFAEEAASAPAIEIIEETGAEQTTGDTVSAGSSDFELELAPQASASNAAEPATTEDFINELVAEIDGFDLPMAETPAPAAHARVPEAAANFMSAAPVASVAGTTNGSSATSSPVPEVSAESLNQLSEVFQEFRAELGELGEEDEDLETHYNLGIAYREMGLLDEAIGEFQKVAKAVQKGKPFRYTMNCSTMLGLCFMDKGEPKIASHLVPARP